MRVERRLLRPFAVAAFAFVIGACGASDVVAVVDGTEIAATEIAALHPDDRSLEPEERAASTFLVILHHLLLSEAERAFGIVPAAGDIEAAFFARTRGLEGRIDEVLAGRGVTRSRVELEAELDALRDLVQLDFVTDGASVDLDAAYRRFVSVNSVVCVRLLAPASPELEPTLDALVFAGATGEEIEAEMGDGVERIELGCMSPSRHPEAVASVAVDGEVGKAYERRFSDGTMYAAVVTERDAPPMSEVMDEVLGLAADTEGRERFDEWAFEILRNADVEVDPSVGTWEPTEETGGVPTVVAP